MPSSRNSSRSIAESRRYSQMMTWSCLGVSRLSRVTSALVNSGMMISRRVKKPIAIPEICVPATNGNVRGWLQMPES